MKKSIFSRFVLGYGILMLIVVLMVISFGLNLTIETFNYADRSQVNHIIEVIESLAIQSGMLLHDTAMERFNRLSELQLVLITLVAPEHSKSFYLPERLHEDYREIQVEVLGPYRDAFRHIQSLAHKTDETLGPVVHRYLGSSQALIESLNEIRDRIDLAGSRLILVIGIVFAFFTLLGAVTVVVYFFFFLPEIAGDYRTVLDFSRGIDQGKITEPPVLARQRQDEIGDLFGQLKNMLKLKDAI